MIPLLLASKGQDLVIKKITGNETMRQRLKNLGLVDGTGITVISQIGGNFIIKVKETRIAIDVNLAKKIMV